MSIDFSELALSPNESRAARNYFGLSQAQAAAKSNLPAHKLKRFESGNYVPDSQFVQALRDFFEAEGYNFHDDDAPGAKARANGDVFPAGVVGATDNETSETGGSPSVEPGKLPRPQKANLQFMRITPSLDSEQIDRVFDCIEENETAIFDGTGSEVVSSFFGEEPSEGSQAKAVALLRRLAENGLLYARLMGRDVLPLAEQQGTQPATKPRPGLFTPTTSKPLAGTWKTVGEVLQAAMNDVQRAAISGDKVAQARRKARPEPSEVLQALVG